VAGLLLCCIVLAMHWFWLLLEWQQPAEGVDVAVDWPLQQQQGQKVVVEEKEGQQQEKEQQQQQQQQLQQQLQQQQQQLQRVLRQRPVKVA
jgi:flagellar biosynthesis/type III secretory pathway M-ring protein FliF/YscJ